MRPLITMMCPSLDGGWGRVLANLANSFDEMDFNIHFAVDRDSGSFAQSLNPDIGIFQLRTTHRISGIPGFSRYVLRYRPEVIMTVIPRHTALALRVRHLSKVPARIYPSIHNSYGEKFKDLSPAKFSSRLKSIKKYYPLADGIVAVSEGVKASFCSLTGISPQSVVTIYNPVVDENLTERASAPLDHRWFRPDQPPVIIGAGRLEKHKNFPLLIKSFEIARKGTECRLMILGDGGELENLRTLAERSPFSGDISLMGYQKNPYAFMKRASLFVLSSSWEGLPTVLIEAMATGTPVVSTDCPSGPREILMDGEYGSLVPLNSPAELGDAILRTLQDPLSPEILQKRASQFSVRSSVDKYLRFFGLTGENT